jgi:glycerol-3-phosphate dehydrogenase (NAD(P)+)
MKKIGCLGAGAWGFCLASLLAGKGYQVVAWTRRKDWAKKLNEGMEHPHLPGAVCPKTLRMTTDLQEVLDGTTHLVESVTSAGLRPVFEQLKALGGIDDKPLILTSKGIEQNSRLILPDVVIDVLGPQTRNQVALISGPSFAVDVAKKLPTSIVATGYSRGAIAEACVLFNTDFFRVYPNSDVHGVAYGGALKNIIAIACGMSDGLHLGHSAKAALMTRGLHEINKLALAHGCKPETMMGLAGMGDVCLTCGSITSRNYRLGYLIAQGMQPEEAMREIDMVVEGAYTCITALQLSKELSVSMPITEIVHKILYEKLSPKAAVAALMQRTIKEEHL